VPFALWTGWLAITALDAGDQLAAGAEVFRWVIALVAFILALQYLQRGSERRIIALIAVLAIAGALEAMVGTILSLLQAGPESFQVGDAFSRAFGTFGRPNTFAGYLEITLFPVVWLTIEQARRTIPVLDSYRNARRFGMAGSAIARRKLYEAVALLLILAGSSAIMLAGITFSYSRGAWVGVAAGASLTGLLFLRRHWLPVLCAAPVAFILLLLGLTTLAPASLTDRVTSVSGEIRLFDAASITLTDDNFAVAERMAHWQAGWEMFEDNPLTGVGAGNFNASYDDYFSRTQFRFSRGHAHNYYIHVLGESGIVGLALYLMLAFGVLFLGLMVSWGATTGMTRALALGATGSMTAIAVHNVFENLHVLNMGISISVIWALAIVAHQRWRNEHRDLGPGNMEYCRG
jgi:O-antigen ligase